MKWYQKSRNHVIRKRVQKFCFYWDNVSWYKGLKIIAWMTIVFGLVEFLIFSVIILRASPSNIEMFFLFPEFCIIVILELVIFVVLGLLLLVGLTLGKLQLIKNYPWGMLAGYILAAIYIILVAINGSYMVKAIVWSDEGANIKSEPKKERKYYIKQLIIFHVIVTVLILALVLFTTYIIILSLSWIDKLEIALER